MILFASLFERGTFNNLVITVHAGASSRQNMDREIHARGIGETLSEREAFTVSFP